MPNYIGTNLNNYSIVVVLEYAGIKIVIPGDNEKSSLDELMERKDFKDAVSNAYILLAPHHGRESGYNSDFVSLVNPSLTIISDGKYCDTSANKRYSQNSSGWEVYKMVHHPIGNASRLIQMEKCMLNLVMIIIKNAFYR